jgi:hypothetical protein
MLRKFLIFLTGMCAIFIAAMFCFVQYSIHRSADISFMSPSGDYKIEYVSVNFPYMYTRYAYIRVYENANPARSYRSPIAQAQVMDLRCFENKDEVGVVWLMFDKKQHRFDMGYPQWQQNWLNYFISNTPYNIPSNG